MKIYVITHPDFRAITGSLKDVIHAIRSESWDRYGINLDTAIFEEFEGVLRCGYEEFARVEE